MPPTDSKSDFYNYDQIYLDVKPMDSDASYAFRNLTEISFTVEGVNKVTVFLVNRTNDILTVRKFNPLTPGGLFHPYQFQF